MFKVLASRLIQINHSNGVKTKNIPSCVNEAVVGCITAEKIPDKSLPKILFTFKTQGLKASLRESRFMEQIASILGIMHFSPLSIGVLHRPSAKLKSCVKLGGNCCPGNKLFCFANCINSIHLCKTASLASSTFVSLDLSIAFRLSQAIIILGSILLKA
eukprot:NODE_173_length_14219_cov_0.603824.p9 type:complete len:159 gc:universal NODE_173_length_14219_cov_0.603824:506-982(+)